MKQYVIDTSIFVSYLRYRPIRTYLENEYALFSSETDTLISQVTIGELRALALEQKWGSNRRSILRALLQYVVVLDFTPPGLFDIYADLDAEAETKHPTRPRSGSSNTIGKDDLWIAATAVATGSPLLTADRDFLLFDSEFLPVHYIDRTLDVER